MLWYCFFFLHICGEHNGFFYNNSSLYAIPGLFLINSINYDAANLFHKKGTRSFNLLV